MTPERWNYIKALRQQEGAYFHVSKRFTDWTDPDTQTVHKIPLPGITYNVGKNAEKLRQRNKFKLH